MAKAKPTTVKITSELRKLGHSVREYIQDDLGNLVPMTRNEMFARKLWDLALGYEEEVETETVDKDGKPTVRISKIRHEPERWAYELIYNRLEGSVATVQPEDTGRRIKAKKDVDAALAARLNVMAGQTKTSGPPPPPMSKK